jgi:hypothetical protein
MIGMEPGFAMTWTTQARLIKHNHSSFSLSADGQMTRYFFRLISESRISSHHCPVCNHVKDIGSDAWKGQRPIRCLTLVDSDHGSK